MMENRLKDSQLCSRVSVTRTS